MDEKVQVDLLQGGGNIADVLLANHFSSNALRPVVGEDGKFYINNESGDGVLPVTNATLRKDEWIHLDTVVTQVARERLDFVQDLISMGLTFNLPNAMGHTVLQYQNQSDVSDATVSMDGINKGDADRPAYDLTSMPIPIIHKDFYFSAREIATSRNSGTPLDTSMAELCSRKVSETAEKLHLGTYGTYKFGGGNVYGLRNFPNRITTTYSDWTATSKTAEQRFDDILTFLNTMRNNYQYGPYGIYVGGNLEQYLDEDYKANSDLTLRERILKIGLDKGNNTPGKIRFVKALDYLSDDDIFVVRLASDVMQTVQGMDTTTLQWQTNGGMLYNFKVMAILVPRMRSDYNDKCGILHATKA